MDIISPIPSDLAEQELANRIKTDLKDEAGIALFNLDTPEIREVDGIVWSPTLGFFLLETKGFQIEDFKAISLVAINYARENHRRKYGHKPPPWKGAKATARKLASYFDSLYFGRRIFPEAPEPRAQFKDLHIPYISFAVFFPFIREEEFRDRFPQTYPVLEKILIFKDSPLRSKLEAIAHALAPGDKKKGGGDHAEALRVINEYKRKVFRFAPEEAQQSKYDWERLNRLENTEIQADLRHLSLKHPAHRYGYAGTGKTVIGLALLRNLALGGKRVLYTCFNKVLASDFRRWNRCAGVIEYKYLSQIDFKDIHQIITELEPFQLRVQRHEEPRDLFSKDDFQAHFERVVATVIADGGYRGVYDYIVIDEGQDLNDYAWRLLEHLSVDGWNTIMSIYGREQNLYRDAPSPFLVRHANLAKKSSELPEARDNHKRRNRVFKNSSATFLFAQSMHDHFPNDKTAGQFIARYLGKEENSDDDFTFTKSGSFPYFRFHTGDASQHFRRALKHFHRLLTTEKLPHYGLLILVPFGLSRNKENNAYRNLAVHALAEMQIDFIDYTNDDLRRLEGSDSQVRICTFHSARGLEAHFSLVLGLEHIEEVASHTNCDPKKLAYIALTRAIHDTVVFVNHSKRPTGPQIQTYVEKVYSALGTDHKFFRSA